MPVVVAELLAQVRKHGADVQVRNGVVGVVGASRLDPATVAALRCHAAELRSLVSPRRAVAPGDAVLAAQRLLSLGQWPPTAPVCSFHCGAAGSTCVRCGAGYIEHYPPASGSA